MSDRVLDYLQANRDDLLDRLSSFLAIPSVSTDSDYKKRYGAGSRFYCYIFKRDWF
ncbi:MAG: hypothetical protein ACFWT6_01780 [Virgibacillus proomii]|jgi:acetylornithine deacetylase/succinyl-diaminopimelate desuccinylase-like protein